LLDLLGFSTSEWGLFNYPETTGKTIPRFKSSQSV